MCCTNNDYVFSFSDRDLAREVRKLCAEVTELTGTWACGNDSQCPAGTGRRPCFHPSLR